MAGAVLGASCGGGSQANLDEPDAPAGSTTTAGVPVATGPRSAPRWETITTFSGNGPQRTPDFEVFADAIQWRVRFSCPSGNIRITSDPPPRRPRALADTACTTNGEGFAIATGKVALEVATSGAWEIRVDQQLDRPLDEPLLPELVGVPVLAQGAFHDLEMTGKGTAKLYQEADGTRVLRLEDFSVSNNTDLFVRISEAPSPQTSADTIAAPFVQLGNLKSTVGNQNYVLPPDLPLDRIRSVVIWCQPVAVAYIAAPLAAP